MLRRSHKEINMYHRDFAARRGNREGGSMHKRSTAHHENAIGSLSQLEGSRFARGTQFVMRDELMSFCCEVLPYT